MLKLWRPIRQLLARARAPAPMHEVARALARRAPCQVVLHGPAATIGLRDALALGPAFSVLCVATAASPLGRAAEARGAPVIRADGQGAAFDPLWGLLAARRDAGIRAAELHAEQLAHAAMAPAPAAEFWVANARQMVAVALLDATLPRSGHERMAMSASGADSPCSRVSMGCAIDLIEPPAGSTLQD